MASFEFRAEKDGVPLRSVAHRINPIIQPPEGAYGQKSLPKLSYRSRAFMMMLSPRHNKLPPLGPQELRELATMLSSGIPITQAWAKSSVNRHPASPVVLRQLEKGSSFASSLQYLGLINASQKIHLALSENTGCLDKALSQLATASETKNARNRKTSKQYQWALISNWYDLLNTQLSAGVNPASAILQMKDLIQSRSYNRSVSGASNDVQNGLSISQALSQNGLSPNANFHTLLATAEASGRLSEVLDHQIKIADQELELSRRNFDFWIPKVLYAVCAVGALSLAL